MIQLIEYGKDHGGPPLFAFPGIDGSVGSIEPIVKALAKKRLVIVVDYSKENNNSLEALSTEIAGEIRSRNFETIDVLGQSIGTILAAQLASVHGLRVRKVILACTFTKLGSNKLRMSNFILRLTPGWLYRLSSPAIMAVVCGPVGDGGKHPFFEASKKSNKNGVIKRTCWEINRDFAEDLVKVKVPMLFLMGEKDRFVPNAHNELERLKVLFKGRSAKIVPVPDAGHVLLPSEAIAFAIDRIEAFLNQ